MKVEVMSKTKPFEPITLTITLESRDELLDMYVRNSISNNTIIKEVQKPDFGGRVVDVVGKDVLVAAVNSTSDLMSDVPILMALKTLILP